MPEIVWHKTGEKYYETGVDQGVHYTKNEDGEFVNGVPWNGLVAVNESPGGAEPNKQYADNKVYLNLVSQEELNGTIEAFTYPKEFSVSDGQIEPIDGLVIGQQRRRPFGFSYRSLLGNDVEGIDFGYTIHLVYNALTTPSEKSRQTMNESPEAMTMSWEFQTEPVQIPGGLLGTEKVKATAGIKLNSRDISAAAMKAVEDILYGRSAEAAEPRLPLPHEIYQIVSEAV